MNQYTIEGETYLSFNDALFTVEEEVTDISNLEEGQMYLHEGNVGTFELPPEHMSFGAIFKPHNHPESKLHYSTEEGRVGDEFTTATCLSREPPDGKRKCPNCGGVVPPDDEDATITEHDEFEDNFTCYACGLGSPEGVYEDREE